jgi:hypothetical protein
MNFGIRTNNQRELLLRFWQNEVQLLNKETDAKTVYESFIDKNNQEVRFVEEKFSNLQQFVDSILDKNKTQLNKVNLSSLLVRTDDIPREGTLHLKSIDDLKVQATLITSKINDLVETIIKWRGERERVEGFGIEVVICSRCSSINSLSSIKCSECLTSLKWGTIILNPYFE